MNCLMTISTIVMAFSTLIIAIFAVSTWLASRNNSRSRILVEFQRQYAEPEMGNAVAALWELCDHHLNKKGQVNEKKLVQAYENRRNEKKEGISLHNQRRMVSHFYGRLAAVWDNGWLPGKLIFSQWSTPDLEIIPKILVPLEKAIRKKKSVSITIKPTKVTTMVCSSMSLFPI